MGGVPSTEIRASMPVGHDLLRALIDAIPDAAFVKDRDGRYVLINRAGAAVLGRTPDEVAGRTDAELFSGGTGRDIMEVDRRVMESGMAVSEEETGEVAGRRYVFRAYKTPLRDADGRVVGLLGVCRDITRERRHERAMLVQVSAARALAAAGSPPEVLRAALRGICTALGWKVGAIWTPIPGADALRCEEVQAGPEDSLEEFVGLSRAVTFPRGVGLPGRVFAWRRPAWIEDVTRDENFPRAPTAARAGLHAAIAFPVLTSGEVSAVLEFFSDRVLEPDETLLAALGVVGGQVGQFLDRMRAGEAVRAAEARWRALVEQAPDFIFIVDRNGVIRYLNRPGWAARTVAEVAGLRFADTVVPEDRGSVEELVVGVIRTGVAAECEARTEAGGRTRWYLVRAHALEVDGGREAAILVARDVTERRQIQAALAASEERFRTLIANVPGAVCRCACDPEWTMEFLSDGIEDLAGYPAVEFVGNRVRSYASIIHPDDRQAVERAVLDAVARREPFTLEYRIVHRDGRVRWVFERGRAIYDASGAVRWLDGVILDVSGQKEAQEALRALADEHRFILEHTQDFVYRHDVHGVFTYVSPAVERISGRTPQEWMVHYSTYMTDHPDNRAVVERTEEALRTGRAFPPYLVEIYHRDGRRITLEVNERPYFQNGRVAGIIGVARDVTERIRREEELRRMNARLEWSNRMLEEYARVVSHDLQAPVRTIEGFAELLERRYGGRLDGEAREFLGFIREGCGRMRRMVQALLELGRVTRSGRPWGEVDLSAVVRDVAAYYEREIAEAGGRLDLGPLPKVIGDDSQMWIVFSNLISNAVKFRRPDRALRIRIRSEAVGDRRVRIVVEDNGRGFAPGEEDRVFVLFQRGSAAEGAQSGEGIGLAICAAIVERMGGRIRTEAGADGGARIVMDLPMPEFAMEASGWLRR